MKYLITLILLIPICLHATIINVNHDGSGDYTTIQDGINNASPGDTVLVYPGNYIETIDFLGKDIVVGSLFLMTQDQDYIMETVIDGNSSANQLVKFNSGESLSARLVGFSIVNCSPAKETDDSKNWVGLAITVTNSSPSIENNRIIGNHYSSWYPNGGGIGLLNSSALIRDNLISDNDGALCGAGIYMKNSNNVVIEGNHICDHELVSGYGEAYGSGIYVESSENIVISGNEIYNNDGWGLDYGGGIAVFLSEDILICGNEMYENRCTAGGGIYTQESEVFVIGNLIHDNRPGWGAGGVYFHMSDVLLVNNTICNNIVAHESSGWGGGMACSISNITVYNSIFYGNYASNLGTQIYINRLADPDFFFNNIQGGLDAFGLNDTVTYTGIYENNIDVDPHFIGMGDYPYALAFNSPCTNAGSPDTTGLMIPEFDLAGFDRIVQGSIDIGAYENQSHVLVPEIECGGDVMIYPNPTDGKVTILIPNKEFENAEVFVEDLCGNRVLQTMLMQHETAIDLSMLMAGIYLVRIEVSGDEFVNKIIVY